ncbi:fatty-acyl-CoA synthase [Microbacterium terrae]|uniref:Long-chain-fatty-acid--CoA ligase n=1 Tax=Microbacterium terrae TaxID=69369 RepID=A0A0M2H1K0_9MICO|nr:fatty-acid--CoA ligase FadD5 [Microbacterium terrae]KJL40124.1 Long-chain-fatty-acid--CoA ligase [Microbacterium terrae]MBP1079268.1 fatty-acyl-CoA synthase [Microbacterium terrae]GLJ98667.1 putative fatty-acid-CoA ligase FadD [Microbacterium terrae]
MSTEQRVIPSAARRNHWMNQVAGHASMKPDATAFRFVGQSWTWGQVDSHMDAFAAALQRRGVAAGDRVLLLTLNRPEVVEAIFGINRIGAMAVPINFRLTPPEIAYIVDDADASVIVVEGPLAPLVGAVAQITDRIKTVIVIGEAGEGQESYDELIAEDASDFEAPDVPEDTPALIVYTSGTTGRPKGALLDHINMFSQSITCIRANDVTDESDIAFLTAPLFHIAGMGSIAPNFILGIPTVIHPLGAFNPTELLDAWEREGATIVFNVPQQWQVICADPSIPSRDLKIRIASWGAAPASETLLRTMADTFPAATIVAVFGQTELSPITCVLKGEDSHRKIGSVGRPIPTIQYRVVNEDGDDVAPGEVGEILYRGPTLMQGYWRKPVETAEAFAGGWFHSGDLVRQDDEGFVWVVDRKKDMIISGGENVYCAEVENVLFAHPAILDVAIYGRADERWGEIPVAAVVARPGEEVDLAQLQEWLGDKLARYKHPKALVVVEAIARNAGGKVDKVRLRAADRQPTTV